MTEAHASSHRLVRFAAQFMDGRLLAFSAVLFASIVGAAYLVLNVAALHRLKMESLVFQQRLVDQERRIVSLQEQHTHDMVDLIATVYGPSSKTRRPSAVELWSKNRDRELRERLHQLELWRYHMEAAKP